MEFLRDAHQKILWKWYDCNCYFKKYSLFVQMLCLGLFGYSYFLSLYLFFILCENFFYGYASLMSLKMFVKCSLCLQVFAIVPVRAIVYANNGKGFCALIVLYKSLPDLVPSRRRRSHWHRYYCCALHA